MNRFKRAGIRVAAVCAMSVAAVVGVVAPAYTADANTVAFTTVDQRLQLVVAACPVGCTQDFNISHSGVSAYAVFRFWNNYQVNYDVNLWDTACDSHSAMIYIQFDLVGQSAHEQRFHTNSQGCNTRRDWYDEYVGTDLKILAVRVMGCITNYWGTTCYPWTAWKSNPVFS